MLLSVYILKFRSFIDNLLHTLVYNSICTQANMHKLSHEYTLHRPYRIGDKTPPNALASCSVTDLLESLELFFYFPYSQRLIFCHFHLFTSTLTSLFSFDKFSLSLSLSIAMSVGARGWLTSYFCLSRHWNCPGMKGP